MIICERLVDKEYKKVFYITKCKEKDIFFFYIPQDNKEDDDLCVKLCETGEDGFFDLYTDLIKTRREVLPLWYQEGNIKKSMIDWKTPPYHRCIAYSYSRIEEIAAKRRKEGYTNWQYNIPQSKWSS